jgi:peptide/nickel transport system permease protein
MSGLRLLATRLLQAAPVLLLVAVLSFLLMHLLPGDPAVVIAGADASPEAIARLRAQLGLDRPLLEQLAHWVGQLLQGNFGFSLGLNQSVLSAVGERLPVTLSLAFLAFIITLPVGTLLGVVAACFRGTRIDSAVMGIALLGVSLPSFWIAIVSVIVFSVTLGWVPASGYVPLAESPGRWFAALVQPAAVLALFQIGYLARMTRSAMLDVLTQD